MSSSNAVGAARPVAALDAATASASASRPEIPGKSAAERPQQLGYRLTLLVDQTTSLPLASKVHSATEKAAADALDRLVKQVRRPCRRLRTRRLLTRRSPTTRRFRGSARLCVQHPADPATEEPIRCL